MIGVIVQFAKDFFVRMVKLTLMMGVINFILGFIKPYLEVIIYHIIVAPKIYIGSFLHQSTLTFATWCIGLYFLFQFLNFIRKNF